MKETRLTDENYWRRAHGESLLDEPVLFNDIFSKYLQSGFGKSCLEIGCMPGGFLAHLARDFGYFPSGIDYLKDSKEITENTLIGRGIYEYKIYEADFLEWPAPEKYDLVCSFGFIEHFTGGLEKEVVKKHIELLKPQGTLLIQIPNFNYGQYFLHFILDKKALEAHNTKIMTVRYFKKLAEENHLRVVYLNYYGGLFDLWTDTRCRLNPVKRAICGILNFPRLAVKKTILRKLNNRFFSPYIIFIAEKPATSEA